MTTEFTAEINTMNLGVLWRTYRCRLDALIVRRLDGIWWNVCSSLIETVISLELWELRGAHTRLKGIAGRLAHI